MTFVDSPLRFAHPEWLLLGLLVCCAMHVNELPWPNSSRRTCGSN